MIMEMTDSPTKLKEWAQLFRIRTFEMIKRRGNGHWGGSASAADLLTALYFNFLKIDHTRPGLEDRDRMVLSKGHAAPILYQILSEKGFFHSDELDGFRTKGSILQGHPCMNETPGVDMSTGALGHGVSVGLGMALASKLKKIKNYTVVLIGDGDLNEGETWEGIMASAKFKPEGLIFLIDFNQVQLDGPSSQVMPMEPLQEKLRAFNVNVMDITVDGHSSDQILESFDWIKKQDQWPVAVVYKTIKGKGISFTENNYKWHGAQIDDISYTNGMKELQSEYNRIKKIEL